MKTLEMKTTCIACSEANLQPSEVQLSGTVRGEEYTVKMQGLICPRCGYKTIEGADMAEYGRLLSDEYRAAHELLTSVEIRSRRNRLGMSQEEFANYVGVGVASIKRWEMGKIQDVRSNQLIIERTEIPATSVRAYVLEPLACSSTFRYSLNNTVVNSAMNDLCDTSSVEMEWHFADEVRSSLRCGHCNQTGVSSAILITPADHYTVPAYIADLFNYSHRRERSHRAYRSNKSAARA
jgi:putative zinc finger/helix-turn-helix YgiT family protein